MNNNRTAYKKWRSAIALIDRTADILLAFLSAAIVCIVLVSVFFRYVLNHSLSWSDELVRYLFVWFTLLGSAITLREREHIRVEYFAEKLPERIRNMSEIANLICIALFHAVLIILGFCWVWSTRGTHTSALQWPLNIFFYAALPCSAILTLWYAVRRLLRGEFRDNPPTEEAPIEPGKGEATCNS